MGSPHLRQQGRAASTCRLCLEGSIWKGSGCELGSPCPFQSRGRSQQRSQSPWDVNQKSSLETGELTQSVPFLKNHFCVCIFGCAGPFVAVWALLQVARGGHPPAVARRLLLPELEGSRDSRALAAMASKLQRAGAWPWQKASLLHS